MGGIAVRLDIRKCYFSNENADNTRSSVWEVSFSAGTKHSSIKVGKAHDSSTGSKARLGKLIPEQANLANTC